MSWFGILHIRNLCILLRKIVTYLGNFVLMDFCTVKVGKVTGSDIKAGRLLEGNGVFNRKLYVFLIILFPKLQREFLLLKTC